MKILFVLLTFLAPALTRAEVSLAALFSDHAVLQRDKPLQIWGKADPGEKVTVVLGDKSAQAVGDKNGRWQVEFPPQPASIEPRTLIVSGITTITRRDILLGDVWLCAGQSNMDLPMGALPEKEETAAATRPLLRHFRVGYHFADRPAADVTGEWMPCSPQTVSGFSAVGFYFGKTIQAESGVPIGLLSNAVGGTNIELWISQEKLLTTPSLATYADRMRASLADYQIELKNHLPQARDWVARSLAAEKAGLPLPMPPDLPEFPFGERRMKPRCVTLYNGMVAPLAPLSLRGVIWYQGENNAEDALYVEKKKALVSEWRSVFRDPELPFYYVQLAAWCPPDDSPAGGGDDSRPPTPLPRNSAHRNGQRHRPRGRGGSSSQKQGRRGKTSRALGFEK